ncbi:phosphohydrolase [Deinococcus marmoris]|uniref:HD domain-containing protein n=1 Tax=Deinococcus marmoris TaxID=249408 RepID=UPI000496DA5F|nr:phosphohydrolase [Deinococcus marmoris]
MSGTAELDLVAEAEAFALPSYSEAGRAYHNADHVRAMLDALESRGVLTPALALAVWGHDLIYDARAGDNEERSAEVFNGWLVSQNAPADLQKEIHVLILATKHAAPPATRAEALLVDADLAILGASAADFAAYDAAIRQEYAHVSALLYRVGRKKILRGFLNRGQIYTTPEFAELEAQARWNLTGAVGQL